MKSQAYIELSRGEVARRARELWQSGGRPNGRDLEFWLLAEVELLVAKREILRKQTGRPFCRPLFHIRVIFSSPPRFVPSTTARQPDELTRRFTTGQKPGSPFNAIPSANIPVVKLEPITSRHDRCSGDPGCLG